MSVDNVLAVMQRDATDAARLREQQDTAYARRRLPESDAARAAVAKLVEQAELAACRLESLAHTFNSPNFTDRYGDGEACTERAYRLRAALAPFSEAGR